MKFKNLVESIKQALSTDYAKTGIISWGLFLVSSTLVIAVLAGSSTNNGVLSRREVREGMAVAAGVGLLTGGKVRHRRIIEADSHKRALEEENEYKQRMQITKYNPHKSVMEGAYDQKNLDVQILHALNANRYGVRFASCIESNVASPKFVRYEAKLYGQSGGGPIYDEETIKRIKLYKGLVENRDGTPRNVIITDSDKKDIINIDIERHSDDPMKRGSIDLSEILAEGRPSGIQIPIGYDYSRQRMIFQHVERDVLTHTIICGESGSGKSGWLKCLVKYMIANYTPGQVRFILADLEQDSLNASSSTFEGALQDTMHLAFPIITSAEMFVIVMAALDKLRAQRLAILTKLAEDPNHPYYISKPDIHTLHREQPDIAHIMPYLFVICEEAQTLTVSREHASKKNLWEAISESIARQGRKVGIHMVLAYQRASMEEISITVRNQCSVRISMKVSEPGTAAITLGTGPMTDPQSQMIGKMAVGLTGAGDMLFRPRKGAELPLRLQGLSAYKPYMDYGVMSDGRGYSYFGDAAEERAWFKKVSDLEKDWGFKCDQSILKYNLLHGTGTPKPPPILASEQLESQPKSTAVAEVVDERLHYIKEQYYQFVAGKNYRDYNITDFVGTLPGNNGANTELVERALMTVCRDTQCGDFYDYLMQFPHLQDQSDESLAALLIDFTWGTKFGGKGKQRGHEARMGIAKLREKEQVRLGWALDCIKEIREFIEEGGDEG